MCVVLYRNEAKKTGGDESTSFRSGVKHGGELETLALITLPGRSHDQRGGGRFGVRPRVVVGAGGEAGRRTYDGGVGAAQADQSRRVVQRDLWRVMTCSCRRGGSPRKRCISTV